MSEKHPVFVGLDGEMTGSTSPDAHLKFQLIQIGIALRSGEGFVSDIGYPTWNQTDKAMAVNGFTPERIRAAPPSAEVDARLDVWLTEHGVIKQAVPVGWNVGAADMPFVRGYLPLSAAHFGYRAVDLNSVSFTLGEVSEHSWKAIKKRAQEFATTQADHDAVEGHRHDAGWDARAALYEWTFLQMMIVQGVEL